MKNILNVCIKNKVKVSIFTFITISVSLLLFFLRESNDAGNRVLKVVNCDAEVVIYGSDPSIVANISIDFSVNSTKGIISIDGKLYKDNKNMGVISRRIHFYVEVINDVILLSSVNNWVSEVNSIDDALFNNLMIHEFYTIPNTKMQIHFSKKKEGYYGVSTKSIPLIYCSPR